MIQLFIEFFKTGLFAVGGGLATLPFLQDMAVRTGWFTTAQLADMVAVSESTPGPIGVNMATYVGFTVAGVPGALVATLGLIAPSIMVAAAGVGVAALTLVNTATKGLAIVNWKALALAAVILVLTRWVKVTKKWHPIIFLLASAVVGVVFAF